MRHLILYSDKTRNYMIGDISQNPNISELPEQQNTAYAILKINEIGLDKTKERIENCYT